MMILNTIALAILAGTAYRYGGSADGQRWVRPVGVGLCLLLETIALGLFNYGALLCMGSVFIETTYFKKKGMDATWLNFLFVGLSFSLALLPWFIINWWGHGFLNKGFLYRIPICAGLTVAWQQFFSHIVAWKLNTTKDITDEFGRGAIQILTMPLFLI